VPPRATPAGIRPDRAFFGGIEGLRAVAALLVVTVHVAFVSGVTTAAGATGAYTARAEVGVGVFFVISGFLLYRPWAVAHLTGAPPPVLGQFLVRRLLRIVPLYWVALAMTLLLVPAARPRDGLDALLLPLFGQVYRSQTVFLGVPQAWSLCVEILFYLALPAYAAVLGRRRRSGAAQLRIELIGVAALYAVGLGCRWLLELTSPVPWRVWHGFLPVWFDLFALGFGLAVVSARWTQLGGPPRWLRTAGGTAACWAGAVLTYVVLSTDVGLGRNPLYERGTGQAVVEEVLWGLFAVLLLLPAVAGTPRPLTWRPVAFLGLISYGIYLWHQLVVESLLDHTSWDLFRAPFRTLGPTVLVLTGVLAAAGYLLVERPGIALGHRWRARTQRRREELAGVG
jgi:peptidoglycan/LPS O-acetylase OafA/YrhL